MWGLPINGYSNLAFQDREIGPRILVKINKMDTNANRLKLGKP
jgi:hypothetical protein